MKRLTAIALAALFLGSLGTAAPALGGPPAAADRVELTIIGTNDFHGALESRHAKVVGAREVGGIGTIAAYFAAIRKSNPDGVILLDGGDVYQGTLLSAASEGRAAIEFYNAMGYDASAIGNHDFDFGPVGYHSVSNSPKDDPFGVLKQRISQANFPFLMANVFDRESGKPLVWPKLKAWTVLTRKGIKVGVIGLTSVDTALTTHPANVRGLEFKPLLAAVRRVLPEVRKAGATVIMLVAHAGVEVDEASGEVHGPVADLIRNLGPNQLDLVIAGHTHLPFSARIAGVPVLQAWPNGISFTRADLIVDRRTGKVVPEQSRIHQNTFYFTGGPDREPLVYEGVRIRPVARYTRKLKVFRRSIAHLQRIRLGRSLRDLSNRTPLDSPVGNLVTDAMRAHDPSIQIAMYNSGGLRTSIPKGVVTFGRVYEVVPFDNMLVKVTLTGAQVREILEHGLSASYGVMEISGLEVEIDDRAKDGKRCISIKTSDGSPLVDKQHYVVGTNEFVLNGGDGYFTFSHALDVKYTHTLIRELVARYIKNKGTVAPEMGGRYRPTKRQGENKNL